MSMKGCRALTVSPPDWPSAGRGHPRAEGAPWAGVDTGWRTPETAPGLSP